MATLSLKDARALQSSDFLVPDVDETPHMTERDSSLTEFRLNLLVFSAFGLMVGQSLPTMDVSGSSGGALPHSREVILFHSQAGTGTAALGTPVFALPDENQAVGIAAMFAAERAAEDSFQAAMDEDVDVWEFAEEDF